MNQIKKATIALGLANAAAFTSALPPPPQRLCTEADDSLRSKVDVDYSLCYEISFANEVISSTLAVLWVSPHSVEMPYHTIQYGTTSKPSKVCPGHVWRVRTEPGGRLLAEIGPHALDSATASAGILRIHDCRRGDDTSVPGLPKSGIQGGDATGNNAPPFSVELQSAVAAFTFASVEQISLVGVSDRSEDIYVEHVISLDQVALTHPLGVEWTKEVTCTLCCGRGANPEHLVMCSACNGTGIASAAHRLHRQDTFGKEALQCSHSTGVSFSGLLQCVKSRCPVCSGLGEVLRPGGIWCPACGGRRAIKTPQQHQVIIPAGVVDGTVLRFPGAAGGDVLGRQAGDVVVVVRVNDHDTLVRHEANLEMTLNITLTEALAGFERTVEVLNGRTLTITKKGVMTVPRSRLEVLGEGLPVLDIGNYTTGGHFTAGDHDGIAPQAKGSLTFIFDVTYPSSLSSAAKEGVKRILDDSVEWRKKHEPAPEEVRNS